MVSDLSLVFWFVGAYSVVVLTSAYTSLVAASNPREPDPRDGC